jgi:hypothetical protein
MMDGNALTLNTLTERSVVNWLTGYFNGFQTNETGFFASIISAKLQTLYKNLYTLWFSLKTPKHPKLKTQNLHNMTTDLMNTLFTCRHEQPFCFVQNGREL